MKILHINAGTETGGGRVHLLSLLSQHLNKKVELLTFQNGLISEEATKLGINTTVLNQKNQLDISILKPLTTYINSENFDVIHTHGPRASLFVRLIYKFINAKWVITVHSDPKLDFINKGIKGKLFSFLNVYSIKKADKIISVSREIKEELIQLGIPENNIQVIHNGIDFCTQTKTNKVKNKKFTVTHIARFHPIKRHEYLLDCFNKSDISNYCINFIGDGELLNTIKNKVKNSEMRNNVVFHGYLDKVDINNILEHSDLTVLSSLSETFPLVLLESANKKVPFITTDVGDVIDMDPNHEFSWIVPINDKAAFVEAIEQAYKLWEKKLLSLKGEQAFKYLSKNFTLKMMAERTWEIYQNI